MDLSPVTYHLSPVTCQVSHVLCHLSHVTCHMSLQEQPQQQILPSGRTDILTYRLNQPRGPIQWDFFFGKFWNIVIVKWWFWMIVLADTKWFVFYWSPPNFISFSCVLHPWRDFLRFRMGVVQPKKNRVALIKKIWFLFFFWQFWLNFCIYKSS